MPTATLFSYDIVKRWRPLTGDHQLVLVGKITTVVGTVLAIVLSPIFGHYGTIIEGLNKLPPLPKTHGIIGQRSGYRSDNHSCQRSYKAGSRGYCRQTYHHPCGDAQGTGPAIQPGEHHPDQTGCCC